MPIITLLEKIQLNDQKLVRDYRQSRKELKKSEAYLKFKKQMRETRRNTRLNQNSASDEAKRQHLSDDTSPYGSSEDNEVSESSSDS